MERCLLCGLRIDPTAKRCIGEGCAYIKEESNQKEMMLGHKEEEKHGVSR